jgi:hypothetical protein
VPTESGDRRSARARTGAPACASTALTPIVRSSVLFPDMFDPLTTSTAASAARRTSLPTHCARGSSGWPSAVASNSGPLSPISGSTSSARS